MLFQLDVIVWFPANDQVSVQLESGSPRLVIATLAVKPVDQELTV